MIRIAKTDRIEFGKLLKVCDRSDLLYACLAWTSEEELTKEQIVEKLIQEFPEKIVCE